jgi:hypothetical protein
MTVLVPSILFISVIVAVWGCNWYLYPGWPGKELYPYKCGWRPAEKLKPVDTRLAESLGKITIPWDCGEKSGTVTCELDVNGVFRISGTGRMNHWLYSYPPWEAIKASIIELVIEEGVTDVSAHAFKNCTNLTSITIPNSAVSTPIHFELTSATIHLPDSMVSTEHIGNYVASINVSDGNPKYSSIDGVLFDKDKTLLIKYPRYKKCTTYIIPNGVISIKDAVFAFHDYLTSVVIPSGVTSIGARAFADSKITSVTLPNSMTSIGDLAFAHTGLTSITIPSNVTYIESSAFWGCRNLKSITFLSPVPPEIGFRDCSNEYCMRRTIKKNICFYVPEGSIELYRSAYGTRRCIKPIKSASEKQLRK